MDKNNKNALEPSLGQVNNSVPTNNTRNKFKRFVAFIGPAYLISVGYMDPGNWATDLAAGSQFGYKLLWVLVLSNIMALVLQSLSARLGLVRGLDLAQISRLTYPKAVNIALYLLAEIAIAACDLAEIIGMAIGLNLLFDIPLMYGILITAIDTFLILTIMNKGIRLMETLIISMIFMIGAAFLINLCIVKPDMVEIAKGLIPTTLDNASLYISIGIIGATVMPHNLYLHSSLVQTRSFPKTYKGIKNALKYNFLDTAIALNLALFVNAAILILASGAFHTKGLFEIAEIQDAHRLLGNLFGSLSPILFAIALIIAGQSSTITGTLAGQVIMEGYINLRIRPWLRRLITRGLAIIPAIITILYFGDKGLGKLLILSQVVLSLQLGFAIIPLIQFCSNKMQMGAFVLKLKMQIAAWLVALVVIILNVKLVVEEIENFSHTASLPSTLLAIAGSGLILGLLLYIIAAPMLRKIDLPSRIKITPHTRPIPNKLNLHTARVYKKIGIAVDFSATDELSLQEALRHADEQTSFVLLHIVETASARYLQQFSADFESVCDEIMLQNYLAQLKDLGYKNTITYKIGFGEPKREIIKLVKQEEIDLLIMGTHGHKLFKGLALGSTINFLRRNINIPILIVNKPDKNESKE